ncbi:sulfatase family protein [Azohydromonas aeria]|uniref:sulfatase family protein n=1 Tax=Azohydromonas aeria TaxID=2590212 RepID=UPI0012FB203F|nr:sulfatase [Azohydromonas aeria]
MDSLDETSPRPEGAPVDLSRRRLALALPAAGLAQALPAAAAPGKPNIVFVVADDLDYELHTHMAQLRALVTDQGVQFMNHFVSLSLCGPSRATMLRGQFGKSTGIVDNQGPYGGFEKFFLDGLESSTYATWLKAAGYRTALMGKYLNTYPSPESGPLYVPPGWDTWFVPNGGNEYGQYNYSVNDNGVALSFGSAAADHFHDVMQARAVRFLREAAAAPDGKPFLLVVTPFLPHGPTIPPPRYKPLFPGVKAPRPPNYNEADVSDKPGWLRSLPLLNETAMKRIDAQYRHRRQCAQALDDLMAALVNTLAETGTLSNTYVFFTSDNGYFNGEHRIPSNKTRPYEESIRIPLVARGPGIPAGRQVRALTANVDVASTLAELGGARPAGFVDGRSLVPYLRGQAPARWRRSLLLESQPPEVNGRWQSYRGLRTADDKVLVLWNYGFGEYYDLRVDPYQMVNTFKTMPATLKSQLTQQLRLLQTRRIAGMRAAEEVAAWET